MTDRAFDEELRTERLTLRRPVAADIDAIFAVHHDPRTLIHNPSDAIATVGEAAARFARWDEHWQRFGVGYWVVRHRDASPQLGFCGLKVMRLRGREVLNLFYRFDPATWGHGLASEAVAVVVGAAVECSPSRPVIARVRPENVASLHVAAKVGLAHAEHLDEVGSDGLDWILVSHWD